MDYLEKMVQTVYLGGMAQMGKMAYQGKMVEMGLTERTAFLRIWQIIQILML